MFVETKLGIVQVPVQSYEYLIIDVVVVVQLYSCIIYVVFGVYLFSPTSYCRPGTSSGVLGVQCNRGIAVLNGAGERNLIRIINSEGLCK